MLLFVLLFTNLLYISAENDKKLNDRYPPELQRYNDYNSIIQYLNKIKRRNPDKISSSSIGTTKMGYKIPLVKISFQQDKSSRKPIIFIDAGTHAREWMTVAVALYLIEELGGNELNEDMLLNVDWYIIPILNPDGFEYSIDEDRNWRKNLAEGEECDGVDLNRNFGYHWGEVGASNKECSVSYAGPRPFSERETQFMRNVTLTFQRHIKLYVSLHAFGELLLYPWGYKDEAVSETFEELHNTVGNLVATAMNNVRGAKYETGRQSSLLYKASGISIDWTAGVAKIPLNYIMEVTNKTWKFAPPASEIIPTSQEVFAGFVEFHKFVEMHWLPPRDRVSDDVAEKAIANGRDTVTNYKQPLILRNKKQKKRKQKVWYHF